LAGLLLAGSLFVSALGAQEGPRAEVLVDGESHSVSVIVIEGKVFYRLRDIATVLQGKEGAFDVTWDRQVFVTRGGTYTAQPLEPETDTEGYVKDPQIFVVDGEETTVNSLLLRQHYYLPVRCLNKVIGTRAEEIDGALVFPEGEAGDGAAD